MEKVRQFLSVFFVALLTASLVSGSVQAATFEIVSCKSDGTVNNPTNGGFFDVTKVVPDGKSGEDGCAALDETKIFSNIVCNFVSIMNQVLGSVYCGMQHGLLPVLSVILTLYVCVFGLQVLIGMVQISTGEVLMRLLKIGAVWAFASQGGWGVGMLYKFFVGFSLQGIDWVLHSTAICVMGFCVPETSTTIHTVFSTIDEQIYALIAGFSDEAGEIAGGLFSGKQELISFLLSLAVIAFPLYMMMISLLWLTLKIFAKTMTSFLMGIAAVAFLISLSPIFLSCMLFKTTAKLFETWLSYLIAYSVQPVITFAILAVWLTVTSQFMGFTKDLTNTIIITPKAETNVAQASPTYDIAFCPLEYSEDSATFFSGIIGSLIPQDDGPRIKCKKDKKKETFPPEERIVVTKMIEDSKFLYFLTYHLVTLLVIGYAFSNILEMADRIAQGLAGASSAVPLSGGFGSGARTVGGMMRGKGLAHDYKANSSSSGMGRQLGGMVGNRK